jgi:hypothetical protein
MSKIEKSVITRKQLYYIMERYNMRIDHPIVRDGFIDVAGDVYITDTSLRKLPLKFGKVKGDFSCHTNKLKTLKGAPEFVGGDFNCSNNQLKNLKYAPNEVGGSFSCHDNVLTSLHGSPRHVKGNFNAFLNKLVTLGGSPEVIDGNCSLFENQLITLKSGPKCIGQSLHLTGNLLHNLVGIPESIGNILSIDNRTSLYMGNQNCKVKRVEIEVQKKPHKSARILPSIIIENQKYLPTILKYMSYLTHDIYSADDTFNKSNFEDIIYDIKSGLR